MIWLTQQMFVRKSDVIRRKDLENVDMHLKKEESPSTGRTQTFWQTNDND